MTSPTHAIRVRRAPFIAGGLAGPLLAVALAACVIAVIALNARNRPAAAIGDLVGLDLSGADAQPAVVVAVAFGVAVLSLTAGVLIIAMVERWALHPRPIAVAVLAPVVVVVIFAAVVGTAVLLLQVRPPEERSDSALAFAAVAFAVASIPVTAAVTWVLAQRLSRVPDDPADDAPLADPYELDVQ